MHVATAYLLLSVQLNHDFWLFGKVCAFYISPCHSEKCLWKVLHLNRCELEPESLLLSEFNKLEPHSILPDRYL
jgi:hypothetical protein